ncbi:MAG: aldo/keto reductase [Rhodospirillum sp.]|nr:aldo/keto reductase [Rhodospirillum sp.]MCF8488251.1 aldo/keto reductase [Rhodospirillum sp.]MCF8501503.1 aldo/keto reductase [Rhodospirillum sp.]
MLRRPLGPFDVAAIGLGCMNLSHAYGVPVEKQAAIRLLNEALDLGYDHLDTAALYGFGANEALIGEAVSHRRSEYKLASKCGMRKGPDGKREINGRPEVIKDTCEDALRALKTDVIDLYYLHRRDFSVPIEESVGALAELVGEGKIRSIGLSEISAETLRKAHAVHPVTAVQTEYSPWTREAEIAVLSACAEMGIAFVAFSPVARGFLTDCPPDPAALPDRDIRRGMPRFQADHYPANLTLLDGYQALAKEAGYSAAQLSLAWVLAKGDHIHAIPGTTNLEHLKENLEAATLSLDPELVARVDALVNNQTVSGLRYAPTTMGEIDTEVFA